MSRPAPLWDARCKTCFPPLFERAHGLIDAVYRDQTPQSMEIEPVMPGRGAVNLRIKLTPLQDVNNITYGLVIVADDLTAIKQREATLSVVRTYLSPRLVRHIQSIDDLGLSGDEREVSMCSRTCAASPRSASTSRPKAHVRDPPPHVASDAIELHDGIIDKYMGDAVVGLFNTQLNPQDDHAVRAVRAALSMPMSVRAARSAPARTAPELRHRDRYGHRHAGQRRQPQPQEFTAIGRPFNFAKLLQENAQAGQIIVSERTRLVSILSSASRATRAAPRVTPIFVSCIVSCSQKSPE